MEENKECCSATVRHKRARDLVHRCRYRAVVFDRLTGLGYCRRHDPVKKLRRRQYKVALWEAEAQASAERKELLKTAFDVTLGDKKDWAPSTRLKLLEQAATRVARAVERMDELAEELRKLP